jgi:hypothetical protein
MPDSVLADRQTVREIVSRPIPERFARGWHALGPARRATSSMSIATKFARDQPPVSR